MAAAGVGRGASRLGCATSAGGEGGGVPSAKAHIRPRINNGVGGGEAQASARVGDDGDVGGGASLAAVYPKIRQRLCLSEGATPR